MAETKNPQTATAPANGTKSRGRKAGQPPKQYNLTGLTPDFLAAPMEVNDVIASQTAPMRARDAAQTAMDSVIAGLYAEWVAKGEPVKWPAMPKKLYAVNPEASEGLRMLIRRAAAFYGYSIKFGKPARNRDGREIVVFAVRSQRTKTATTAAEDNIDDIEPEDGDE